MPAAHNRLPLYRFTAHILRRHDRLPQYLCIEYDDTFSRRGLNGLDGCYEWSLYVTLDNQVLLNKVRPGVLVSAQVIAHQLAPMLAFLDAEYLLTHVSMPQLAQDMVAAMERAHSYHPHAQPCGNLRLTPTHHKALEALEAF